MQLQIRATKGHPGSEGWVAVDEFQFLIGEGEARCKIEPPLANPRGFLILKTFRFILRGHYVLVTEIHIVIKIY